LNLEDIINTYKETSHTFYANLDYPGILIYVEPDLRTSFRLGMKEFVEHFEYPPSTEFLEEAELSSNWSKYETSN
jgi:hypothetical protein